MRARRTIRECTIPGHVSAETHSAQLTRLNNEVDRLKAENLALRALIGNTTKRDNELMQVLERLAAAFLVGVAAGYPAAAARQLDPDPVSHTKNPSREPRGGDPGARRALYVLQRQVEAQIDAFDSKMRNGWKSRFDFPS